MSHGHECSVVAIDEIDSLLSHALTFSQTVEGASGVAADGKTFASSSHQSPARRNDLKAFDDDGTIAVLSLYLARPSIPYLAVWHAIST